MGSRMKLITHAPFHFGTRRVGLHAPRMCRHGTKHVNLVRTARYTSYNELPLFVHN